MPAISSHCELMATLPQNTSGQQDAQAVNWLATQAWQPELIMWPHSRRQRKTHNSWELSSHLHMSAVAPHRHICIYHILLPPSLSPSPLPNPPPPIRFTQDPAEKKQSFLVSTGWFLHVPWGKYMVYSAVVLLKFWRDNRALATPVMAGGCAPLLSMLW